MNPVFCEITQWWNWHYMRNQISPHFYHYPVQLMIDKGFDAEVLTVLHPERRETPFENYGKLQIRRFTRNNDFSFYLKFLNYMMRRNYSLIHLHDVDWFVDYLPWFVSRMRKTPMVFTSHSPALMESLVNLHTKMSLRSKMLLRNVFMLRDSPTCVFIAFTQCQAEFYKMIGIENISLIPHGIDPSVFQVEHDNTIIRKYGLDEFNMLCVGTIEPRKGQLLLIKSLPAILAEFPNTKLFLLGRTYTQYQSQYLTKLKLQITRLNLEHKVVFLDDVPKNDLIQLYMLSSLFVFPTEAEMAPLVLLEAMAAGLPIVLTNKPYLKEIIGNGEAGILVEREQKSIESAILHLLGDNALMSRIGSNGKKIVEQKHRLDKVIQQYWDLYESLLNYDN